MKFNLLLLLTILCINVSCKKSSPNSKDLDQTSSQLFQKTLNTHGLTKFETSLLKFNFGTTEYTITELNNRALYTMTRYLDHNVYKAIYDGGYLTYSINNELQEDSDFPYQIVQRSLYGFAYCYSIPFSLQTNDVILERKTDVEIRNQDYYTLDVTFTKIPDTPEDQIILYINKETNIIDYTAIKHLLTDFKPQFRRMINPRYIDGILFQDYIQFSSDNDDLKIDQYYSKYNSAELKDLRKVEITNIEVIKK